MLSLIVFLHRHSSRLKKSKKHMIISIGLVWPSQIYFFRPPMPSQIVTFASGHVPSQIVPFASGHVPSQKSKGGEKKFLFFASHPRAITELMFNAFSLMFKEQMFNGQQINGVRPLPGGGKRGGREELLQKNEAQIKR